MADMDSMETNTDINSLDDLKCESLMDFTNRDSGLKTWLREQSGGEDDFVDADEKLSDDVIFSEDTGTSTSLFNNSSVGSSPEMKKIKLNSTDSSELEENANEEADLEVDSETDSNSLTGLTERIMNWITGWIRLRATGITKPNDSKPNNH